MNNVLYLCYETKTKKYFLLEKSLKQKWKFNKKSGTISQIDSKLFVEICKTDSSDYVLCLSSQNNKTRWEYNPKTGFVFHVQNQELNNILYLSLNYFTNEIYLTTQKRCAVSLKFGKQYIRYEKPELVLNFEKKNKKLNFTFETILNEIEHKKTKNAISIGILLAAGYSSRFSNLGHKSKQLFKLDNDKTVFETCLEIFINKFDRIIVITNSTIFDEISTLVLSFAHETKIDIIKNDVNCRLKSIETTLKFIKNLQDISDSEIDYIVLHDGARPFVTEKNLDDLLMSFQESGRKYSQFCLKLVNGLIKKFETFEAIDREAFIELATPICIDWNLFSFLFSNYITGDSSQRITHEFLPIMNILKINYHLIEGNYKTLRKITTFEDIWATDSLK